MISQANNDAFREEYRTKGEVVQGAKRAGTTPRAVAGQGVTWIARNASGPARCRPLADARAVFASEIRRSGPLK